MMDVHATIVVKQFAQTRYFFRMQLAQLCAIRIAHCASRLQRRTGIEFQAVFITGQRKD